MDTQVTEERLRALEDKIDRLTRLVESQVAWQGKLADFVGEMSPVARAMMDSGVQELAEWDRRGLFAFGSDLVEAVGRAVESYEPGSLPELADSFGDLLLVARLLTQARFLAAAQDVAEEFGQAGTEPVEVLGAAKRIETEKDIQRGMALALDLFGTLGRSVSRAPRLRAGRTAPSSPRQQRAVPAVEAKATSPAPASRGGEELSFVPDDQWSREWAEQLASSVGVGQLSDEMWRVVEFSRADYKDTQKAPNIRRITRALDLSTKDIYALFPSAPGPTISKLAGVPKPAGCL